MDFRITGLQPDPFRYLFGLNDAEAAARGAVRMVVDMYPGYPDRITLREVPVGETVFLVNHLCQPAQTPYRATHAIFVWEGASERFDEINVVPEVMRRRLLSLRAFDGRGMMRDADVVPSPDLEAATARLFEAPDASYIHVHNARQGCFSGRIDRLASGTAGRFRS